jgi:Spy/CpxP family protein refolding chaperone
MVASAKNTGRMLVMTAAIVGALSISAAPGTAYAQHRGSGSWHGGGDRHGHSGTGAAVGLGLARLQQKGY